MSRFTMPIRFAFAMRGGLIAYFLVLSLFNLHTDIVFSLFNGVIVGFGIYEVIKYTQIKNGAKYSYTDGLVNGVISGFVATIIFTFFFFRFLRRECESRIFKWINRSLGANV